MKAFYTFLILLMLGSGLLELQSCRRRIAPMRSLADTGSALPFHSQAYQSDRDHFRTRGNGNSTEFQTARKVAQLNTRDELALIIQSCVSKAIDQLGTQREAGLSPGFIATFEEIARQVAKKEYADLKTLGERIFRESNRTYTYWMALELPKQSVMSAIDQSMAAHKELEKEFDRKNFEVLLSNEMEKAGRERTY
jgi:hypothetical protein